MYALSFLTSPFTIQYPPIRRAIAAIAKGSDDTPVRKVAHRAKARPCSNIPAMSLSFPRDVPAIRLFAPICTKLKGMRICPPPNRRVDCRNKVAPRSTAVCSLRRRNNVNERAARVSTAATSGRNKIATRSAAVHSLPRYNNLNERWQSKQAQSSMHAEICPSCAER